jgi:Ca-activated chloride channel family protein
MLIAVVAAWSAAAQQAPEASSIVLILDGSGSMWGQVEGTAKITIAKQTMASIIESMPDTAQVGLILYGHRRKGDCDDVELAVPLGPVDKPALSATIEGINPKGKTPITRSLRAAAEVVRADEGTATVVLVSDGEETCDPDPCAAIREIEEAGVPFVVHVIGFDVNDEQRAQLECIADAGGGRYFTAANAEDLEFAARTATMASVEEPASGEGRVWIDEPATAVPGGTVVVHFEAAPTFHDNAWMGVVPSEVPHGSEAENDRHDLGYEYLRKRTSGTLELHAPAKVGSYDVRMHDSDHDGREVASAPFEVVAVSGRVWLDKKDFATGEAMSLHFEVPAGLSSRAWVGIVPSEVPHGDEATNDKHDVGYQYLSGRTEGTLGFSAPSTEGSFDFRLHDSDSGGSEIATVTFSTAKVSAEVWLDQTTFFPGAKIPVHFKAPGALGGSAWIGLVPPDIPHGSARENDRHDVNYAYVSGQAEGTAEINGPKQAGKWEARLHDSTDSDGNELAFASFEVELPTAELVLGKTVVEAGEKITVSFKVPEGMSTRAWAGIVPSEVPHGSEKTNDQHDVDYKYLSGNTSGTLSLTAPEKPGSYDIRLHDTDDGGNEIASVTFSVK